MTDSARAYHDPDDASLLLGPGAAQLFDLYDTYRADPGAVGESWRQFFDDLDEGARQLLTGGLGTHPAANGAAAPARAAAAPLTADALAEDHVRRATVDSIRALMLIRAYRVRGTSGSGSSIRSA